TTLALWLPSLYVMQFYESIQQVKNLQSIIIAIAVPITILAAILNFLTGRVWLSLIFMAGVTAASCGAFSSLMSQHFEWQVQLFAFGVVWAVFLIAGTTSCFSQDVAWRKLSAACP